VRVAGDLEVCGDAPSRGNRLPETHLAALLKENGVATLYSNDADFRRFAFLDVRNPLL
jgi:predicted nucleic acid-binding protein